MEVIRQEALVAAVKADVAATGGAKKWLRKHKLSGFDHVLHMVEDGRIATDRQVLRALGYREIRMFEKL